MNNNGLLFRVRSFPCRGRRSARHLGAVLSALCVLLAGAALAAEPSPGEALAIELNKLEPNGAACRAYLVIRNGSAQHFDALKLDLVMFDRDGVVARRLAVQAAPLPLGKTSLKVFDIDGGDCAAIGSILLNDVLDCQPAPVGAAGCLGLVAASARGDVPFIK